MVVDFDDKMFSMERQKIILGKKKRIGNIKKKKTHKHESQMIVAVTVR